MKNLLVIVLVLLVGIAALGYWRGWFGVTKEGQVGVQVDAAKFKQDKDAFSKTVGEKAKAMKHQVASLLEKSKLLKGDAKAHAETELAELNKKHDRLEKQINEFESAGQGQFETLKQDLSRALEEVEKRIAVLTSKMEKGHDK